MLLRRRPLKKLLIAVIAACAAMAVTAVAVAQNQSASLQTTVTPKKAGTAKKPVSTNLYFKVVNNNPNATLSKLDILIPKTLKLATKGWPSCSQAKLDNSGKSACPRKSNVGTG